METPQHLVDKSVVGSDDDKWLVYEVEEKAQLHHDVKLILLRNVDDYGVKGQVGLNPSLPHQDLKLKKFRVHLFSIFQFTRSYQVVSVPFHLAHPKLLLPGFADYHTEENVEKYVFCKVSSCDPT